jgi:hypothetical protein
MRNLSFLYSKYKSIFILTLSGFIFFFCGLYLLLKTSIPGGLIFIGLGLLMLSIGWYNLTYPFGMTYFFRWDTLPRWKRLTVYSIFMLLIVAFVWLAIESIKENLTKIWNGIPGVLVILGIYFGVYLIRKSK